MPQREEPGGVVKVIELVGGCVRSDGFLNLGSFGKHQQTRRAGIAAE